MRQVEITLTPKQSEIYQSNARHKIVVAGRRSGKTEVTLYDFLKDAERWPGEDGLYIAPTYRQAKRILWKRALQLYQERLNTVKTVNISDLMIEFKNGFTIWMVGADNFDSLRGIGPITAKFDEPADIHPDTWYNVVAPALSDKQGYATFTGTPKGRGNWLYDLWCNAENDPTFFRSQYTSSEGGIILPEEIELRRQQMDPLSFKQEFEADWVDFVGRVYYGMTDKCLETYDGPVDTIHIGMDFNVDPMCASIAVKHKDGMHVIDEIELRHSGTHAMCDEINKRYPGVQGIVYPDATGGRRDTRSGTSDHAILHEYGKFIVCTNETNPPVRDRINSMNKVLSDGMLKIDPKCKRIRKCLDNLSYKEGTNQPNKHLGLDHFPDALGYSVAYNYPIHVKFNRKQVYTAPGSFMPGARVGMRRK